MFLKLNEFNAVARRDGEISSHGISPIMTEKFVIPVRGFYVIFGLDPKIFYRRISLIALQKIVVSSTTMTENVNFDNDIKIKSCSKPITRFVFLDIFCISY